MHFIPLAVGAWFNLPRKGGVAYVAQESWVQNETIRNNILFGSAYDEIRYQKGKKFVFPLLFLLLSQAFPSPPPVCSGTWPGALWCWWSDRSWRTRTYVKVSHLLILYLCWAMFWYRTALLVEGRKWAASKPACGLYLPFDRLDSPWQGLSIRRPRYFCLMIFSRLWMYTRMWYTSWFSFFCVELDWCLVRPGSLTVVCGVIWWREEPFCSL